MGRKIQCSDPDAGYSTVNLVGLDLQAVHDVISDYKTKDGSVNTNVALTTRSRFWRKLLAAPAGFGHFLVCVPIARRASRK